MPRAKHRYAAANPLRGIQRRRSATARRTIAGEVESGVAIRALKKVEALEKVTTELMKALETGKVVSGGIMETKEGGSYTGGIIGMEYRKYPAADKSPKQTKDVEHDVLPSGYLNTAFDEEDIAEMQMMAKAVFKGA